MFTTLQVNGFRAFSGFEVPDLARVNLFVGRNNIGKTTLLEAIQLLATGDVPAALASLCAERGEWIYPPEVDESDRGSREAALACLFKGRSLVPGASIRLVAHNTTQQFVDVSVVRAEEVPDEGGSKYQRRLAWASERMDGQPIEPKVALKIASSDDKSFDYIPLSAFGGLPRPFAFRRFPGDRAPQVFPLRVLSTIGLSSSGLAALLDRVVLQPAEDYAIRALRIIEPNVDRIAAVGSGSIRPSGRDIVVRMMEGGEPVPLGSLGEGMRRLLGVSLSLAGCANGILLADEIDTGLHYGTLEKMWRLVIEAAKKLNIQVFATTHSSDCVRAFGQLCHTDPGLSEHVRLHRIEGTEGKAVAYSGAEVFKAGKFDVELRG